MADTEGDQVVILPQVVILLTDGYQTKAVGMVSPTDIAGELKKQGATVFVLGAGPEIDWNLLVQIANGEKNVIEARNYNDLFSRFNAIQSALKVGCIGSKGNTR